MELRRAEHHIYRLQYHLVWTPKYRRAVFAEPQRHVLKAILEKTALDYWGGRLWSPSYYAETIGRKNEVAVSAYIRNQLQEEVRYERVLKQLKLLD